MQNRAPVLNGNFILGFILGLSLLGCAGLTFPYKHYKPELKSWEGSLLGDKPENDLDAFYTCSPDTVTDGKCVVLKAGDFFRLKQEYLDLKQRLIDCEHQ